MKVFEALVGLEVLLAVITFVALMRIVAPYGRHARPGWGPTVPARVAWIAMEAPAVLWFLAVYLAGADRAQIVPLVLLAMWQIHYIHRTFVFPFRLRTSRPTPILIPLTAIGFNVLNGTINARWISHWGDYAVSWLWDPRFLVGAAIFMAGMAINIHSDNILLNLRHRGEPGYKIPRGGMYRYVSAPNYLGELMEWVGWAIATWSWAGAAFALYTAANLVPRALANHRWYQETFPDYPVRKAIIPRLL